MFIKLYKKFGIFVLQVNGDEGTETLRKVPGITVESDPKTGWSVVKISTAANKIKASILAQFRVLTKYLSNFLKRIRFFLSKKFKKTAVNNLQSECNNLKGDCYETPIQPKPTLREKIKNKLKKLDEKNRVWGEKTHRFIKKKKDLLKDKNRKLGEKTSKFLKKKWDFLKKKNRGWGEKTSRIINKSKVFLNNKNREWRAKTHNFINKKKKTT